LNVNRIVRRLFSKHSAEPFTPRRQREINFGFAVFHAKMGYGNGDSQTQRRTTNSSLPESISSSSIESVAAHTFERQSNPAYSYLGSLKASGRRTMRGVLEHVAAIGGLTLDRMDWASLRYEQITLIKTKLNESGKAPATVNKIMSALRGVARECWRMGLMDVDAFMRIKDIGRVVGESAQAGRALSSGEVDALFRAIMRDGSDEGVRDGAILSLLYAVQEMLD